MKLSDKQINKIENEKRSIQAWLGQLASNFSPGFIRTKSGTATEKHKEAKLVVEAFRERIWDFLSSDLYNMEEQVVVSKITEIILKELDIVNDVTTFARTRITEILINLAQIRVAIESDPVDKVFYEPTFSIDTSTIDLNQTLEDFFPESNYRQKAINACKENLTNPITNLGELILAPKNSFINVRICGSGTIRYINECLKDRGIEIEFNLK